jgi:hypothetical protein
MIRDEFAVRRCSLLRMGARPGDGYACGISAVHFMATVSVTEVFRISGDPDTLGMP